MHHWACKHNRKGIYTDQYEWLGHLGIEQFMGYLYAGAYGNALFFLEILGKMPADPKSNHILYILFSAKAYSNQILHAEDLQQIQEAKNIMGVPLFQVYSIKQYAWQRTNQQKFSGKKNL